MNLPLEIVQKIKLEYQREYTSVLKRLQDLKSVLDQLQNVPIPETAFDMADSGIVYGERTEPETSNKVIDVPSTETKTAVAKKTTSKGKRGRKSVWGKFILSRLKSVQRPLTLDDLANHATVTMNLDPENFGKTRQSLVNAVFGLRQKNKITTVGVKGTREKVIALPQWLDDREKLLPNYQL